jgi:protein-tyrosine phosphatase
MSATTEEGQLSRLIELEGAFNLRDVGGYHTVAGRSTRWRRLLRSDSLHRVNSEDLARLVDLRVANILDLRSPGEIEFTGQGLLAYGPFNLVSVPTGDNASTRTDDEPLAERYLAYLSGDGISKAIAELANVSSRPTVVSCFFGKDRTGTLIALILDLLGVQRETIIADYALTSSRMGPLIARLRQDELYRSTLEQTAPSRLAADPATMRSFLNAVDEHYGSVELWALSSGLGRDVIEQLRENLLV